MMKWFLILLLCVIAFEARYHRSQNKLSVKNYSLIREGEQTNEYKFWKSAFGHIDNAKNNNVNRGNTNVHGQRSIVKSFQDSIDNKGRIPDWAHLFDKKDGKMDYKKAMETIGDYIGQHKDGIDENGLDEMIGFADIVIGDRQHDLNNGINRINEVLDEKAGPKDVKNELGKYFGHLKVKDTWKKLKDKLEKIKNKDKNPELTDNEQQ